MTRTDLYGIEEHLKVQLDQLSALIHVPGQTQEDDVVNAEQRNQNQGGLGQFPGKKQQLFSTSDTFSIIVQLCRQHTATLSATRSQMLMTTLETTFTQMLMEHWYETMTRRVNCSVCNNVDNEST